MKKTTARISESEARTALKVVSDNLKGKYSDVEAKAAMRVVSAFVSQYARDVKLQRAAAARQGIASRRL